MKFKFKKKLIKIATIIIYTFALIGAVLTAIELAKQITIEGRTTNDIILEQRCS